MNNTNTCKWHLEEKDGYDLEEHDYWETSCDNLFQFSVDQKIVDCFKFCPYCGRPIEEVEEVKREYPCPKCNTGELYDANTGGMFASHTKCNNPDCDHTDPNDISGCVTA